SNKEKPKNPIAKTKIGIGNGNFRGAPDTAWRVNFANKLILSNSPLAVSGSGQTAFFHFSYITHKTGLTSQPRA
ncbi:MAG: hypothetical protein P8I95_05810, partial [Alphaproteobacteria bacterium]|nr:hypothetical protein [Alphaproteobacteria bacterium]